MDTPIEIGNFELVGKFGGLKGYQADGFFINEVGLTGDQVSYSIGGLKPLLEDKGPLLVTSGATNSIEGDGHHIIVVIGIYGDGNPNDTYLVYHDPWMGEMAKEETYAEFMTRYQRYIDKNRGNGQELHLYYFD